MAKDCLNYFCKRDGKLVHKIAKMRAKMFLPVSRLLMNLGITADMVSYFGFLILIGFIFFIERNPALAVVFLILHVVIDAFDGPLAKLAKTAGDGGAFTDILCDHTGMVVVIGTLIYYGFVSGLYGAVYIYVYTIMIIFTIIRNRMKDSPNLVLRTKYYVYILYAVWAFTNMNYLNEALLVFTIIKLPSIYTSYKAIKKKLGKKK